MQNTQHMYYSDEIVCTLYDDGMHHIRTFADTAQKAPMGITLV